MTNHAKRCPRCGGVYLRSSKSGLLRLFTRLIGLRPIRCEHCRHRFWRFWRLHPLTQPKRQRTKSEQVPVPLGQLTPTGSMPGLPPPPARGTTESATIGVSIAARKTPPPAPPQLPSAESAVATGCPVAASMLTPVPESKPNVKNTRQ